MFIKHNIMIAPRIILILFHFRKHEFNYANNIVKDLGAYCGDAARQD